MNIRDLEYALAVEAERSFSRAAEACGVAQPTLSAQLRKLEDRLGVTLFERDGREIRVTAAGASILNEARVAVDAVRHISELAGAHADPRVGALRVGVIPTLAPYILPQALRAISQRLPRAPLVVIEDVTQRLIDGLSAGRLDAAIIATDEPGAKLSEIVLFDEPFRLAMPNGHPLVSRPLLGIDDVDPLELILLADGHCLADQAVALCREGSAFGGRTSDLRATSLETVLNLVEAGLGVTIVPELARACVEPRFPGIVFRDLRGDGAWRRVRIVHRAFSPRREVLAEIAECIARPANGAAP